VKILFAGTPDIAVSSLKALADPGRVTAVLTNPDEPVGRHKVMTPPPVKQAALEWGLPVFQPESLTESLVPSIKDSGADLLVCFAYGKIFPGWFLDLFPLGGINIHPSLLPRYRGPSPLTAAILAGDTVTGISIQTLSPKMDCGDILLQREFPLEGNETTGSLTEKVARMVPDLLLDVVGSLKRGTVRPVHQNNGDATYCRLVKKEDGLINWLDPAEKIQRQFRAFTPWPGIHTTFGNQKLSLLSCVAADSAGAEEGNTPGLVTGVDKQKGILIQTGQGLLAVTELQLQSRKSMDFRSFLNGTPGFVGQQLGGCH
jgi:methionyl-tRNA formyltransferase